MQDRDSQAGKAIAYLMFGVMAGLGLDLCAKQILIDYSLEQFVFLRSLIGAGLFLLIAARFGGLRQLKTRNYGWHGFRTLLSCGAMFGFFYGLKELPLMQALTLGYTAPLMVTALSAIFLTEDVGWRRWIAVLVGFSGVLITLRPGSGDWTPASASVLFAALCYAGLAISSRRLAKEESSLSLSLYVITGPILVSAVLLARSSWTSPDLEGWLLITAAGACSVFAWIGLVGGYRRASPAMLAPFEYTALVAGAIAGFVIWQEVPDQWTIVGAVVISASGLFVAYREIGNPVAVRYLRALTAAVATSLRRQRR